MAERNISRALASSIHSEDLLSDMELLPASEPNTPGRRIPCSQPATPYGSNVTAQLYSSLHQSRQAEAEARSHLENHQSLALAEEGKAANIDLDVLAEELSHRLSTGVETSSYRKGSSGAAVAESHHHITEMESVRGHLQSMLRGSRDAAHEKESGSDGGSGSFHRHWEGMLCHWGTLSGKMTIPLRVTALLPCSKEPGSDGGSEQLPLALQSARPLQESSPPGSLAGLEDLFPRYASLRLGHVRDQSSYADCHQLKDSLDREQARRKHCERHIRTLQHRILELQQQLAVAVSAEKKKDSMIEQLDKTLAKVVEGWNRHEAERTAVLGRLQAEKEATEQALGRQKEKSSELEERLEQALSALSREQQAASQYCKEKELLEEAKASLSCTLEAESSRARNLEAQRDLEQRQLEALRATLEGERQDWARRERQLEQHCHSLEEQLRAQLETEKALAQREAQKVSEAQRALASVQSEAQGLRGELEAVRQERENLKMEMSLMKARYEAQKVKLESELKVALEQRVTERLAEVHEEGLHQMSAMREQHRKQLLELSSHHEKELASQLAQFKSDLAEREERQRHLIEDYEHRLSKQQDETRELQAQYRRLESQRAEMVNQFQAMMQAHWNEALRLLSGSGSSSQSSAKTQPQEAPPNPDPTSSDSESLQPSEPMKKSRKAGALESSQAAGDCVPRAWAQAVPHHPVAQRGKPQGTLEAPEKSVHDAYQQFLPLLPDLGRPSSDFSHVLNYSLLSQHGFQPLEAQMDATVLGPGLSLQPENLAEHPFTDDMDETLTEGAGNEGEISQHDSSESSVQLPQHDLNYYMRLLWDQSAHENCPQKQEDFSRVSPTDATNQTQFGTSLSYHERSTALWEAAQPSAHTIRIQAPSSAAVQKTKVPLLRTGPGSSSQESTSPSKQNPGGSKPYQEERILSPKQVAELSRLLKQYQAKGRPVPSPEELYRYLREMVHSGTEAKGVGNLQTRRNPDLKLPEVLRKEGASARRSGTLGTGREKPQPPAKAGKKPSVTPAPNPRSSRGGSVWR